MPDFKKTLSILFSILTFSFVCPAIFATQSTRLHLTILDPGGGTVTTVNISIKRGGKVIFNKEYLKSDEFTVQNLTPGAYLIEIDAPGFAVYEKKIDIKPGLNPLTIHLELRTVVENVNIERGTTEKRIDDAFTGFFTREQIEALPDDPEEIRRVLQNRYGADVIIRVDGFSGRIPDRSRIASIKATMSSYDAENHLLGVTIVDITTKVVDQTLSGSIGFNFNDEALNARDPLSERRLPRQNRSTSLFLFGNLLKNKSSFDLIVSDNRQIRQETINAVLPAGIINTPVKTRSSGTYVQLRVKQNLPRDHSGLYSYTISKSSSNNLGIGGFNLPERGYNSRQTEQTLQFSDSGQIQKHFFNELRAEYKNSRVETVPESTAPSIIVLDAFSSGGAGNEGRTRKHSLWIADNFLFSYRNHAIKTGGLLEFENYRQISNSNGNGTFIYSSLDDFAKNRASRFTRSNGQSDVDVAQIRIGVYLQDDFKIRKSLGVSLGIRYELQNNLHDRNNFSPRLGFTWLPFDKGNTVFRGGAGIFYNWLDTNALSYVRRFEPGRPGETVIIDPWLGQPSDGTASQLLPFSFRTLDRNAQNPYVLHTSLGFDTRLSKKISLTGIYTFEKGVHILRSRNINAPIDGIRPNSGLGNVVEIESSGFFVRNSLNLQVSGALRKGVSFGAAYTLAKRASDVGNIFDLPSDNFNLKTNRGPADDDMRHQINASINWKIRKGVLITIVDNIFSPLPYTVTTGLDNNGDTAFNDRPPGIPRNSMRGSWRNTVDFGGSWSFSFIKFNGKRTGNTAIFLSNDEIARDNETTSNDKRFLMKLSISALNVLNQTNYLRFVGVQTSPLFGKPILAGNPRRINVGLRFNF